LQHYPVSVQKPDPSGKGLRFFPAMLVLLRLCSRCSWNGDWVAKLVLIISNRDVGPWRIGYVFFSKKGGIYLPQPNLSILLYLDFSWFINREILGHPICSNKTKQRTSAGPVKCKGHFWTQCDAPKLHHDSWDWWLHPVRELMFRDSFLQNDIARVLNMDYLIICRVRCWFFL